MKLRPAVPSSAGAGAAPRPALLESATDRLDRKAWAALEAAAVEPNVFAGPSFAVAHRDAFGLGERLRALRLEGRGGELDALLLFRRRPGFPFHASEALIHPFAGTSAPLVRPAALDVFAEALVGALREGRPLGRSLLLPMLPAEGRLAGALTAAAARHGVAAAWLDRYSRPVLEPREGPASDFPVSGGAKLKKYRQMGRRLAETGRLETRRHATPGEVDAALRTFLDLELAGWKGRQGTAALCQAADAALFRGAVPALAADGMAFIDTLELDGRTIASGITLSSAERSWLWKIAYDETLARYSPYVQLLMHQTAEALAGRGPADYDSCAKAGSMLVERVWHQRREYGDLLMVAENALPGPALALSLETERRRARRLAVRVRDAVRDGRRLRPAP